jgi:ATP-dependent Clp protease ATP-binding subunit ClpC
MIVSGCKFRGEFEEKIKNILKEVVSDPNVILFIDEIHTIIGAGNPENGMDIANILKPYLARGEISCIGATTFDEYKKTIADDPALCRRFQTIKVEEPSKEETFRLVKSIKESYEKFHFISYSDEILKYAIDISDKYLQGRFPDKVIDLIDQTGSNIKLQIFKKTPQVIKLEQVIHKAGEKLNNYPTPKNQENVEKLLSKYQKVITKIVEGWQKKKYIVQEKDILNVVSNKTNIPSEELNKQDFEKLKLAKQRLEKEIIGQTSQIDQIYKCLLRAKAGFRNEKKPIASLLFAGPTGVGKTFTSQIIAEQLYLNKNSFIHIDMSEYADKTAINKLIGSNPGYVGYEKGGVLTEKVKKNPYSIVLFDEIQKADPDVLFSLLQVLEEGKLMDSYGNNVDFSSCIIILTTNIGSEVLMQNTIGFNNKNSVNQNDILTSLRKYFPADLLNRIDEIIVFNNLQEKEIKLIINKEIERVAKDLNKKNIELIYKEEIINHLFNRIQLQNFGARQVNKTIQRELQTLIAEKILENSEIKRINLEISDGKIVCNI